MPACLVYEATNRVNDKRYIGQTNDFVGRRKAHLHAARTGAPWAFSAAIRKHGEDNFDFQVRAELPTAAEAKIAERILIALERPAYNMTAGGDGTSGYTHDPEKRAATGRARRGVKFSDEHKARLKAARNARPCKPCSEETKILISKANSGKIRTPEVRAKISAAKMGNTNACGLVRSTETRAKISATKRAQHAAARAAKKVE
jgi:group I intron endonuclease